MNLKGFFLFEIYSHTSTPLSMFLVSTLGSYFDSAQYDRHPERSQRG